MQVADPAPSVKIDLTSSETCPTGLTAPSEVVVCGRRDGSSRYRLKDLPPPGSDRPRAETQLSRGLRASAETENADVFGRPSNRLMVRLKFKF
jgi:hypothetical protein